MNNLSNISIDLESLKINNHNYDNKEIKIGYLKDDEIPEIKILKHNLMLINGKEISINSYLKKIKDYIGNIADPNNSDIDLLDDNKYNQCNSCGNPNDFFCEKCKKHTCNKCKDNCLLLKHEILVLKKIEDTTTDKINNIKTILDNYIIPIKIENERLNKEIKCDNINIEENEIINNSSDFKEEEDNHNDIFLIFQIISTDYKNFFHYKNIEGFEEYCIKNYSIISNIEFKGYGKHIFEDGTYYLGEWDNSLINGLGILFYKNGNIQFEGEWIYDIFEGYGRYIYENGDYYEGEFKNGLKNGKGILYTKNNNIQYMGDWINNDFNGYGIHYFKNGQKYEGEFKEGLRNGKGTFFYKNGNIQYEGN